MYYSDVLYSMETANGVGYVYALVEHQSSPDKLFSCLLRFLHAVFMLIFLLFLCFHAWSSLPAVFMFLSLSRHYFHANFSLFTAVFTLTFLFYDFFTLTALLNLITDLASSSELAN